MSLSILVTLALAGAPQVQGFGSSMVGSRPALTVFTSAPIEDVRVERSGSEVTVLLAGAELGSTFGGAERLQWQMPEGPGPIQIEKRPQGVTVRMRLAADQDVQILKKGKVVALVFGPRTIAAAPPSPSPPPPPVKEPAKPSPEPPSAPKVAEAEPPQVQPSPSPTPFVLPREEKPKRPPKEEKPAEEKPRVLSVRTTMIDARPALTLVISRALADASVERVGTEVVVALGAEAPEGLASPRVEPPLEAIRIERRPGGVAFHVRVPSDVPFQVRRGETVLSVVFGEETQAQARGEGPFDMRQASTADLYSKLFPSTPPPSEPPPPVAPEAEGQAASSERGAFTVGPLSVRPTLGLSYVNSDSALFEPQPVHDEYFQIQPGVRLEMEVGEGRLRVGYEPRFRLFSAFDLVERPSHVVTGSLNLPLRAGTRVTINERFVYGTLEAQEVDPGGEYFFDLARFRRNGLDGQVHTELSGRFGLDFGGGWSLVRFDADQQGGFYDYDDYSAHAGLAYDLTPRLRTTLSYILGRVPPPPERPFAEATTHGANVSFDGELGPQLASSLSLGYQHRTGGNGQRFSGLTLGGSLRKEFRPSSFVGLTLNRATVLSNFEQNAFYVATGAYLDVTAPIPLDLTVRGAVGYQWNSYRLDASAIGEPRKDKIFGWGFGLGRPVWRFAFVRADYRRDRRESNVPGFDVTSDAFILQLGVGLFGSSGPR